MNINHIAEQLYSGMMDAGLSFNVGQLPACESSNIFNQIKYSTDPILSQDQNGILNFGNNAAMNFFGYSKGEFIGMPSLTLIPQDDELRRLRQEVIDDMVISSFSDQIALKWQLIADKVFHFYD